MRSVAPESPGSAASQNSCSVVNLKPTLGSLAITTLHTIQTAKASSRLGMEIQRLRVAMALPFVRQNSVSSGRQSSIACPLAALAGGWIGCISGSSGKASMASALAPRSIARIEKCIHSSDTVTMPNSSAKQLVHTPVRSVRAPKAIGSTKPPTPPIMPTRPPTAPTFFG